jgi:hypothetical protein
VVQSCRDLTLLLHSLGWLFPSAESPMVGADVKP